MEGSASTESRAGRQGLAAMTYGGYSCGYQSYIRSQPVHVRINETGVRAKSCTPRAKKKNKSHWSSFQSMLYFSCIDVNPGMNLQDTSVSGGSTHFYWLLSSPKASGMC